MSNALSKALPETIGYGIDPLAAGSNAYQQVHAFSHLYDRGGSELVNGKPSFTADQAADSILRKGLMATARST